MEGFGAVADLRRQHQQGDHAEFGRTLQTFGVVGYTVLRSDLVTPAGGSMMAKLAVATVASLPEGSSVTVMSMTADRRPLCTTRAVPRAKPSRTPPDVADVHIRGDHQFAAGEAADHGPARDGVDEGSDESALNGTGVIGDVRATGNSTTTEPFSSVHSRKPRRVNRS